MSLSSATPKASGFSGFSTDERVTEPVTHSKTSLSFKPPSGASAASVRQPSNKSAPFKGFSVDDEPVALMPRRSGAHAPPPLVAPPRNASAPKAFVSGSTLNPHTSASDNDR